jgi:DNA methylase/helicase-like protein
VTDYRAFIEAKVAQAAVHGFDVDPAEMNPALKDHTRAMVRWTLAGGRRAIFASFGLHKTCAQLEFMRLIGERHPGNRLIVLPLGVRQEFFRDAALRFFDRYALPLKFIRRVEEIEDDRTVYLTNYESVREGVLDIAAVNPVAASLDEAAILRGFGGTKTFRESMALFAGDDRRDRAQRVQTDGVAFRLVATATPSPNEYIELLAYAAFLGVMDVGQAKTRFFKRNSEEADDLTLHPHKEAEFWLWVASWALFVQKPSDLGFSDEGYDLPPLEVRWHEIPADHATAGTEKDGQGRLLASSALGLQEAAREKRRSLPERVAKVGEIVATADDQVIVWCQLNDEQRAVERVLEVAGRSHCSLYGAQDLEEREALIERWRDRGLRDFVSKPVMYGAGVNLQQSHTMIFAGISDKFAEAIQAIHRIQRFGQLFGCTVHMVYTEAEREIRRNFERKWRQHEEQMARMAAIVREYGLAQVSMAGILTRSIGCERQEARGERFVMVRNDCVMETRAMEADRVGLIVTSIPFSHQYEYSPSYNDFGHTDNNEHFWRQMDFLTPELLRVLQPGRVCAIHVKDRITPGGINGFGFQTVTRISDQCADHFERHGFAFLGRKTVVTDVVRENNQTYRLGWSEQCKDGSRMGAGLPEYVMLFRKPPTDRSNGYADLPVAKDKAAYPRARWQYDAHGYMRSSGNRLLQPEDLDGLAQEQIYKRFKEYSLGNVYDFERDLAIAERVDKEGWLPSTFMLLPPASWHPDVWTDVTRMRTLNGAQAAKGKEMHLCPLQFDIVDRLVTQFSMPGEVVFDPFAGIGTVPLRAVRIQRRGLGCELNANYFTDAVWYLKAEERRGATPSLFDLTEEAA